MSFDFNEFNKLLTNEIDDFDEDYLNSIHSQHINNYAFYKLDIPILTRKKININLCEKYINNDPILSKLNIKVKDSLYETLHSAKYKQLSEITVDDKITELLDLYNINMDLIHEDFKIFLLHALNDLSLSIDQQHKDIFSDNEQILKYKKQSKDLFNKLNF